MLERRNREVLDLTEDPPPNIFKGDHEPVRAERNKMIVPGYTHRNLKNNLLNDENEYLSGKETSSHG